MKSRLFLIVFGFLMPVYTALLLLLLWHWFVTPVFHLSPLGFWQMCGFMLIASVFVWDAGARQAARFEVVQTMILTSVPEVTRTSLLSKIESIQHPPISKPFAELGDVAFRNTIVLVIGSIAHVMAS